MRKSECYIKPTGGEYAQASVTLPQSGYAVLGGRVVDDTDTPVEEALVLLLEQDTGDLLAHTVTDEAGRFWFGPLPGETLYCLRVQKGESRIRILQP